MKMYTAKNVGDYINGADERAKPIIQELRKIIKSAVPNVEEKISWGVPFYRYHGVIGGIAALKNHVDFGFYDFWPEEIVQEFENAGYVTGKKIVQIQFDQKVPAETISRLVKARASENIVNKK